jgi:hypothetical protein
MVSTKKSRWFERPFVKPALITIGGLLGFGVVLAGAAYTFGSISKGRVGVTPAVTSMVASGPIAIGDVMARAASGVVAVASEASKVQVAPANPRPICAEGQTVYYIVFAVTNDVGAQAMHSKFVCTSENALKKSAGIFALSDMLEKEWSSNGIVITLIEKMEE